MSYTINYSGQPYEPVSDMLSRVDSDFVLYEEVETIRIIYDSQKERQFTGMAYGFLKASSNNENFLRKMQRKLNKENTGGVIFKVVGKDFDFQNELLPKKSAEPIIVPRLLKYRKSTQQVQLVHEKEIQGLGEFPEYVKDGIWLVSYNDSYKPVRVRLLAKSEDSAAIIQFRNSLAANLGWKTAILDTRKEREFFVAPGHRQAEQSIATTGSGDILSQPEIDALIEKMVADLSF
ncbi:MAG: hypothetical protein FWG68_02210 [Defluviitaleaceae bacterium]|nr:hypothetical protein [Defluviitaleaceae bacterium]